MEFKTLTKNDIKYTHEISIIFHNWWSNKKSVYEIKKSLITDNIFPMTILLLDNKNIVGVCQLLDKDNVEERKNYTPWLANLFIKEEYRNKGYSKLLINKIIDEAKKLGYKSLYLHSKHINLYEKYGFKIIEEVNGKRIFKLDL